MVPPFNEIICIMMNWLFFPNYFVMYPFVYYITPYWVMIHVHVCLSLLLFLFGIFFWYVHFDILWIKIEAFHLTTCVWCRILILISSTSQTAIRAWYSLKKFMVGVSKKYYFNGCLRTMYIFGLGCHTFL